MRERKDLLPEKAPEQLAVYQLTEEALPSSHVYMEAQIFTPDSKRFVLHRSAAPHGSDKDDPEHRYLVCDLENNSALSPITTETGATAPSISPDGNHLYYFVNETELNGGRLILKRVNLDGSGRETLLVVDAPLPETAYRPSRIYPLSTISSDGRRLAVSGFLGDGARENAPWGLMVFDLDSAQVSLVLEGQTWCNLHPQYCRHASPEAAHDIMVQENHDNECAPDGSIVRLVGGKGADIHLIRDDGADMRSFPWGRDGNEYCQGHQCWRGAGATAITSTHNARLQTRELVESPAAPFAGHVGLATPHTWRETLSRAVEKPKFCHFATEQAGQRLISDAYMDDHRWLLYFARLGFNEMGPNEEWQFVLDTGSSQKAHPHPFLSPDGATGFFNSDESGVLQAYMVTGL